MKTRIITALVALLILAPVLIFASYEIIGGVTVLRIALALVAGIAVLEAASCVGAKKALLLIPSVLASFCLIITTKESLSHYTPVMILLLFTLLFIGVLAHKSVKSDTVLPLFAFVFYIVVSFGALLLVFEREGGYFFPLIFFGAWITDTFAYFTGVFFGRHKLIPEVSPKKTVEGAVGGTLFCIISFVIYAVCRGGSPLFSALLGLVSAIVSQLGDLSASLIKRHYGIKDYGKIFPGHGGVLDRFDSILAVSTLLYLVTELFPGGII